MAPAAVTEDYYEILRVEETATADTITKSYKKLAMLRHPDRNKKTNATQEFQLLSRAYETLKNEADRRAYDLLYPQIRNNRQNTTYKGAKIPLPQRQPPNNKTTQDNIDQENASISAILNTKQERASQWAKVKKIYDDEIFELSRKIRKLQSGIRSLEIIKKAEDAEDAAANSWSTWLSSSFYNKPLESVEEKESKTRDRLQRLHSKDIKGQDLKKKEFQLRLREELLSSKKADFDCANQRDDAKKFKLEEQIRLKQERVQKEMDRIAREQAAKIWKERREREAAQTAMAAKEWRERLEKVAEEQRKRAQAKEAESRRQREQFLKDFEERRKREEDDLKRAHRSPQNLYDMLGEDSPPYHSTSAGYASTSQSTRNGCLHQGWWPKVPGSNTCESCSASHHRYLLECPGCQMMACASCQRTIRERTRTPNRHRVGRHQ